MLLKQVVRIKRALPEDHLSRLALQQALATVLWDSGYSHVALQMIRNIIQILEQKFDKEHPDRKSAERWLEHIEDQINNVD